MTQSEQMGAIEAVLFVSGEPVETSVLMRMLDITEIEFNALLEQMIAMYDEQQRGVCIQRIADKIQMATSSCYGDLVQRALFPNPKQTLSNSALETLSIVAYRQPITRMEIEAIRGVKCDYALSMLAQKGLISEAGRKDAIGRPVLYATTDEFLRHFGLVSLDQLPEREKLSGANSEA